MMRGGTSMELIEFLLTYFIFFFILDVYMERLYLEGDSARIVASFVSHLLFYTRNMYSTRIGQILDFPSSNFF